MTTPAPQDPMLLIKNTLVQLSTELEKVAPNIEAWMYELNANLRSFPELVHLLSDEEIQPLYAAIMQQNQVAIVKAKPVKAAKAPKALSALATKMQASLAAKPLAPQSDSGDLFDGL